jgi:beta-glucosidase
MPNEPLFPFGYGLSYTRFEYSDLQLSADKLNPGGFITATVTVTNKGSVDGAEVVQLYIEDEVRTITPPAKELKGFRKLMLKAGESSRVEFRIDTELLKFWNADLKWVAEAGRFKVHVGSNSRDTQFKVLTLN